VQLNLFVTAPSSASSSPLVGQRVKLNRACAHCSSNIAIAGSSCAMHAAKLTCDGCGQFRGWLSHEDFQRLTGIVDVVGQPTSPINLRHPFVTGLSSHGPF
jgi:hypothetical protein